jgi:DNA-binding transcriptional MerR regulator
MKRTYLHIGELAQLLGITQKTIRHYQKVGLLREPERAENSYRLYDAQDLLRLQRIRRLQALGLSLKQVKAVLGDTSTTGNAGNTGNVGQEQLLRNVLLTLDEELTTRIRELEERQRRVQAILARETPDTVTEETGNSPYLQAAKDYFAQHNIPVSPELMAHEERMYAHLENFHWSDGQEEAVQEMSSSLLHYMNEHQEEQRQLLQLGERLMAIAPLPQDDPEVEQLAQDFKTYFTTNTSFVEMSKELSKRFPTVPDPVNAIFSDLFMSGYTPAQRRVFEEIKQLAEDNYS